MKTVEVEIPDGKDLEWIDGELVLVDEKPKKIIDRIKTFKDACEWCEENGFERLVLNYKSIEDLNLVMTPSTYAYLQLRIITAALNEGWYPDYRYDEGWAIHYGKYLDAVKQKEHIIGPSGLIFKSKRMANYAISAFTDLYTCYFGIVV